MRRIHPAESYPNWSETKWNRTGCRWRLDNRRLIDVDLWIGEKMMLKRGQKGFGWCRDFSNSIGDSQKKSESKRWINERVLFSCATESCRNSALDRSNEADERGTMQAYGGRNGNETDPKLRVRKMSMREIKQPVGGRRFLQQSSFFRIGIEWGNWPWGWQNRADLTRIAHRHFWPAFFGNGQNFNLLEG